MLNALVLFVLLLARLFEIAGNRKTSAAVLGGNCCPPVIG